MNNTTQKVTLQDDATEQLRLSIETQADHFKNRDVYHGSHICDIKYYKPTSALNRFYTCLPKTTGYSDEKDDCGNLNVVRAYKDSALQHPYIQANTKNYREWLIFDIDHDNPYIWDDVDLPPPNLIVRNPENNKSHMFYAIPGVATSLKGRQKPIAFMKAVYKAMAIKLKADLSYSGPVAKTPGHKKWITRDLHRHEYSLGELGEYLDLSAESWWNSPNLDDVEHSRNCSLFETVRFFAYAHVYNARESSTLEGFNDLVLNYCESVNTFTKQGWSSNLSINEIKATAKSIARWTWVHYYGRDSHQRVMMLDKRLPLAKRQSLSAARTASIKVEKTIRNITLSIKRLSKLSGKFPTTQQIAADLHLSRQTVAKHLPHAIKSTQNVISLKSLFGRTNNVNLGLHQIVPVKVVCKVGVRCWLGTIWNLSNQFIKFDPGEHLNTRILCGISNIHLRIRE